VTDTDPLKPGVEVDVTTNDGHRFHGHVISVGPNRQGREEALLRLDSGWEVRYPVSMIQVKPQPSD
jgi:hypothetical protein